MLLLHLVPIFDDRLAGTIVIRLQVQMSVGVLK